MTDWLVDTLLWTGALIALVLMLRRPVSRYLGPQAAYALWLIPAFRLFLPAITLPAAMAPQEPAAKGVTTIIVESEPAATAAELPTYTPEPFLSLADLTSIAMVIWLVGAVIFLYSRFAAYYRMRDEVLEHAVCVGEEGAIRLVETPALTAPVAFGITDKVIALPLGFMAQADLTARDLALDHELAHHRGYDLVANFAVQPLFALHWFNPLGWMGWRALRRDQEAACDARVLNQQGGVDRATYAQLIASFAAGPDSPRSSALAAPMACPVLGDKSIIHRLRSLRMSTISNRRRNAGRALLGAGLLALPLTASISYAESMQSDITGAVPAAPLPPAPPAPPANAANWNVPQPPTPPMPPLMAMQQAAEAADAEKVKVKVKRDVKVIRTDGADGEKKVKYIVDGEYRELTPEMRVKIEREVEEALAESGVAREEAKRALQEVRVELDAVSKESKKARHIAIMEANGEAAATKVEMHCNKDGKSGSKKTADGKTEVQICMTEIMGNALVGLKEARKAIASNPEMTDEMRATALAEVDRAIRDFPDGK